MISNNKQYVLAKSSLSELESDLERLNDFDHIKAGIDPVLVQAQRTSVREKIAEMRGEVRAYEEATSGDLEQIDLNSIEELGQRLIAARLANGWTQRELAGRLGVKEQQIQRYEREMYSSASLDRLIDLSRVLELNIYGKMERRLAHADYASRSIHAFLKDIDVSLFPLREMRRRGWIDIEKSKPNESTEYVAEAIRKFFADAQLRYVTPMLHKRTNRDIDLRAYCSLLVWQAHVKSEARRIFVNFAKPHNVGLDVFQEIASLSTREDGPLRAVNVLREIGIGVVIEEHLPHSLLDGGSMLLEDGRPVIGLTLRQDRIDNFWFVLFHELGHIAMHRYSGLAEGFLDEIDDDPSDAREVEADEFARNALIPDEVWKRSFVRFTSSAEDIIQFARNIGVGPEIVAGRIRRERRDYSLWTRLVGAGKLKKLFGM